MKTNSLSTKEDIKAALVKVAEMFEAKAFIHTNKYTKDYKDEHFWSDVADVVGVEPDPTQRNFNLEITAKSNYDCGTVACIGGWCWLMNEEKPLPPREGDDKELIVYSDEAADRADAFVFNIGDEGGESGLKDLFFPPFTAYEVEATNAGNKEEESFWDSMDYGLVTAEQAAKAIRNYIENDDPDWYSVMKESVK